MKTDNLHRAPKEDSEDLEDTDGNKTGSSAAFKDDNKEDRREKKDDSNKDDPMIWKIPTEMKRAPLPVPSMTPMPIAATRTMTIAALFWNIDLRRNIPFQKQNCKLYPLF